MHVKPITSTFSLLALIGICALVIIPNLMGDSTQSPPPNLPLDSHGGHHGRPPHEFSVPEDFATIQEAINAARSGDIIQVEAGQYQESQIIIDKALKVIGAGPEETIIDGSQDPNLAQPGLVRITAGDGNVIFSGFTLKNAGYTSNKLRVGLFASSPNAGNQYTIVHINIIGSNNPDDLDYGFYTVGGQEDLVFRHNVVTATGANAVLVEQHTGSTDISFNDLDVGVFGADAIFTMAYGGKSITSDQIRNHNAIDIGTGFPGDFNHPATGITFAAAFIPGAGVGTFTSVQIEQNRISRAQNYRGGITLLNNAAAGHEQDGVIKSGLISGNMVRGLSGQNNSHGIRLFGLVSGTTISRNALTQLTVGIRLQQWTSGVPAGTILQGNRFQRVAIPVLSDPGATSRQLFAGSSVSPLPAAASSGPELPMRFVSP